MLLVADALGLADVARSELERAADLLDERAVESGPAAPLADNPAKLLGASLSDSAPVVWGSGAMGAVASYRLAGQLAENAKLAVTHGILPEVAHGEATVLDGAQAGDDDIFRDPIEDGAGPARMRVVLVRDSVEHPQDAHAADLLRDAADRRDVPVDVVRALDGHPVVRLASLLGRPRLGRRLRRRGRRGRPVRARRRPRGDRRRRTPVIVVGGALRPYAWGRIDGLTRWTTPTAGPQAELWFGHAGDSVPAEHPLLTKLLAAANPLSIQVHPTDEVVARLDASESTRSLLSDHVEKNELLLALEPFTAFAGFRDDPTSARLLAALGLVTASERASGGDHVALVRELFALSEVQVSEAFRRLSDVIHAVLPAHERAAVELVRAWYPHDRGVLVALCLAVHELSEGDALYVPAGVVHSYVNGLGVEVMTASDNVLRLGLTVKHVAVDAALGAMTAAAPTILRGQAGDGVSVYSADGAPFAVRRTEGVGVELQVPSGTAATALCVEGSAVVECDGRTESLLPGQAALVGAHDGGAVVRADGSLVLASAA